MEVTLGSLRLGGRGGERAHKGSERNKMTRMVVLVERQGAVSEKKKRETHQASLML